MSMVAKMSAALVGSAFVTAFTHGMVAGFPADLLLQPYYWVMTVSLAALTGLSMGTGIGGTESRYQAVRTTNPSHRSGVMGVPA
jgi:hypothetical protein